MRFRPLFSLSLGFASSALLGLIYAGSYAQSAKKPVRKPPVAPSATQNGAVIVSGDTSISEGETETSKLLGNVTVTQVGEDFILYSQNLIYSKPKNRAVATEKLRVETRDSTIRGARVDADFNSKILTLTGNVAISTHGRGDGITGNRAGAKPTSGVRAEFASKPSKLFCDRVDWDYETREATLTGNIRMEQGKNRGTCERIEFDERQNVVRLLGRVRFTDDKGQVYTTPDLTIYNDENRIVTGRSKVWILPDSGSKTAPRAPKAPVTPKRAPVISDDELKIFNVTPAPIPALRPEPTEVPEPDAKPAPAPSEAKEPAAVENAAVENAATG